MLNMVDIDRRIASFLKGLDLFAGLPKEQHDIVVASATRHFCAKHQDIFCHGDKADSLWVLMSGWVKLYRLTPSGEEAVIAVLSRGDILGELNLSEDAVYRYAAQAAEDAELIEIPAKIMRELSARNADIKDRLFDIVSRELRDVQMENEHLSVMSAAQRVGCLLLRLSSDMIGKGVTFSFPYDKSLAASGLGMKPETFSRALSQLKAAGVEVHGPEVTINNFEQLREYCCTHCSSQMGECHGKQ